MKCDFEPSFPPKENVPFMRLGYSWKGDLRMALEERESSQVTDVMAMIRLVEDRILWRCVFEAVMNIQNYWGFGPCPF
jgi:hypothetical protein